MNLLNWQQARLTVASALLFTVVFVGCSAKEKLARYLQSGESYYRAGKYDEARLQYLNVLRLDHGNPTAIRRLGEIWYASGSPVEALRYLRTARDLFPADVDLIDKTASAFVVTGHREDARKEALAALKLAPADDEAIEALADAARTPKENEEAQRLIEAARPPDKASLHLAEASLSVHKHDIPAAVKEIERALALDPKLPLAHLAMGNYYSRVKGDLVRAGEELKVAAELSGDRSPARLMLVDFKVSTQAVEEAKALLKEMTGKTPDFLPAWTAMAQIALGEKKYDDALAYLQNVFGRDPNDINAGLLRGVILLETGETVKAEQMLEALDQKEPQIPPLKYQLARAYLRNGKVAQAANLLNEVVAGNRDFLDAIVLQASVNLRRGDAEAAVAALQSLVKQRPELVEPQLILVDAYRSLARLDEASAILAQQIAGAPKSPALHFLLGLVQLQKRQIEEARASFEKAFALEPENVLYLSQIIELDLSAKSFDGATQRVQGEIKKAPKSAGLRFLLAKVYFAQRKLEEAEKSLLKALELDPEYSTASELLATIYTQSKDYGKALKRVEDVIAKDPKNVKALTLSALLEEKLGDFSKARDYYEKVLTVSPDDQPVTNNLATVYVDRLNDLNRAYELARKASTLRPADPAASDTLGWVHFKRGEYNEARPLIEKARQKLPRNQDVLFHFGMVNYMLDRPDEARAAFEEAARSEKDFVGKSEIQPRLAILKAIGSSPAPTPEALELLLKAHPGDLILYLQLAQAYEAQGVAEKAAAAYEEALKLSPKLSGALLKLAQLYAGPLKKIDEGIVLAKKAKELAPNDPAVSAALGKLFYQSGNFAFAYGTLQEALSQGGDSPGRLYDFAWAAYAVGKESEAREAMARLLQNSSQSPEAAHAKVFLAMAARVDHPDAAAESEIKTVLAADPAYVPALMALAALETQRGDAKAAMAAYTKALQQLPDLAPAQMRLAALYLDDPQLRPQAYDLATKARKTLTDDPALLQILAEANYDRKNYGYAIELLQVSASKRPLDAKGLFYLGMAQAKSHHDGQARDFLAQALAAGLTEPLATEARQTSAEARKR